MIILGLDASSASYGYSIFNKDTQEVIHADRIKMKSTMSLEEKLHIIYTELQDVVMTYNPDLAVIEDIYMKNVKTLATLAEVRGVSRLAIYPATLHLIPSSTMKKHIGLTQDVVAKEGLKVVRGAEGLSKSVKAARSRKIKKDAVIRLVNERFGLAVEIDDIADAIALAYAYSLTL